MLFLFLMMKEGLGETFYKTSVNHSLLRVTSECRINATSGCNVLELNLNSIVGSCRRCRPSACRNEITCHSHSVCRKLPPGDTDSCGRRTWVVEASNSCPIVAIKTLGYLFPTSVFQLCKVTVQCKMCVYNIKRCLPELAAGIAG